MKKFFRQALVLFGFLASSAVASAQTEPDVLIVELNNDSTYRFLLDAKPVLTFDNDNLIVDGNINTTYELSSVRNYHFDATTSMAAIASNELRLAYLDNRKVFISGLKPQTKVVIYNAAGVLMHTVIVDEDGNAIMRVPSKVGVYVLKTDAKNFKIIKK